MGWVVKTGEVSTEWGLATVTRADRTPTGEASLAGGRVASRQRMHEAAVVTHQVRDNQPRQTPIRAAPHSAVLPLSRQRPVRLL